MSTPQLAVENKPRDAAFSAPGLRRIGANAVSLLFAYGLPRIFTVGAVVVAARALGTHEFGAYGTAAAYAVILSILATLGLMQMLIRDIAREPEHAARFLRTAHLIKLGTNAVMLAALWVIARWALHYPQHVIYAALLLGVAYAIGAFVENLGAYFQAVEQMHVWTQANALYGLVSGTLGAVLVLATHSMVWFCVAPVIGQCAALALLMTRAPALRTRHAGETRNDVIRMLRAMSPFALTFVVLTVYYKADVLLLTQWRRPADVGEYAAAYKFIDILQALIIVGASAVYPRLSRSVLRGSRAESPASRITELMLLVSIPVAGMLWLLRVPVVHALYGAPYADSADVLAFLALAVPALSVNILAGYVLAAAHRIGHVAAAYACALLLKMAIDVTVIPRFGATGAAVGVMVAETVLGIVLIFMLNRDANARVSKRTVVALTAVVAAAMVSAFLPNVLDVLRALIFGVAVLAIYHRMKVLPDSELDTVREALHLRTTHAEAS